MRTCNNGVHGRLQSLSHNLAGTSRDHVLGFAYNPASQIVTRSASNDAYAWTGANVSRAYAVNGLNQYMSAGPATFGYDPNGNLASTVNAPHSTAYVYDVENRLVSASGAHNAELVYDPLGRLFQVSSGASVRRLVYDGDALVDEYDSNGNLAHRYLHGNDSGADDPLVWWDIAASGWRRALLTDHQGSVIQVADMYGNPVATNSYDPWGVPGATPVGRFGYTGQAWVPELGLWYYKARFYSPTLGRFLQVDPIGYEDQVNLYGYTGNDPVNSTDPTGTTVSAVYYADAGVVRARDNDTGEERWASAFSGGTSGGFQGGPVPDGDYAILEGASNNSYRLERFDSHFGDDRTPEGRTDLRFHPKGTQSIGCITCHPGKGGLSIGSLLSRTKTGNTTVEYRGRNPFKSTEEVRRYGSMRVKSGSNIRFDPNTMRVSVFRPGSQTQKARTEYMCTIRSTGACTR